MLGPELGSPEEQQGLNVEPPLLWLHFYVSTQVLGLQVCMFLISTNGLQSPHTGQTTHRQAGESLWVTLQQQLPQER